MTDRELMQQAADKLSIAVGYPGLRFYHEDMRAVLNALRDRLAQPEQPSVPWSAALEAVWGEPEQEPVAHTLNCVCGAVWDVSPDGVEEMVHAPNPPQRKPLTDEEIDDLSRTMVKGRKSANWLCRAIEAAHGIDAIEAKLKEKNT